MTSHKNKDSDRGLYLLHFPKTQKVKISDLRQVTAISQVRVKWDYYKNKRKGPIQCTRCMQYGHGSQSCFLDPVCVRCAGSHLSRECPKIADLMTNEIHPKIPEEEVKCGLCGSNHTANYSQCEKRQEFINRQKTYRDRTQRRNRRNQPRPQNHHFKDAPQLKDYNINFPADASGIPWQK